MRLRLDGRGPEILLLRGCLDQLELTVRMLAGRGTRELHLRSRELYGDSNATDLLAARALVAGPMPRVQKPGIRAEAAAERIASIIRPILGERCQVRLSAKIAAFAAAGPSSIALRADARFTAPQVRALAHHEGLWHVLTSLNGAAQPVLTVLGTGLSGFTETQEGGGIASEALSGPLAPDRLIELAERTLAVAHAEAGADYLEVWRPLAERFGERRACHLAERVFRGGVLKGGAPFTKDAVYLRGYRRVREFLLAADSRSRLAFLAGKMSLEDVPVVRALMSEGLAAAPALRPRWARLTAAELKRRLPALPRAAARA